jgi:cysteine desulfurase family protein (TIGR01976 family)
MRPARSAPDEVRLAGWVADHPWDVAAVRAQFPALAEGLAHFDGPGGTQVPAAVSDAVRDASRSALSNRHGGFASSDRTDALVDAAREAAADLLGADPRGVFFSASMTAGTYVLAGALAKQWGPGDEVVVTRLDHDANVRPWVQAAERAGATTRWLDVHDSTDLHDPTTAVTERTRLVAVTAASNATGTEPDLEAIGRAAHDVGALLVVDGVAATPHRRVDVAASPADVWACSAYKWYGPHLGVHAADPSLLERLRPDKLAASTDDVPDRFELGTLQLEQLAGLTAAVDWIASHGTGPTRRDRVTTAMARLAAHEAAVFARLLDGLTARDDVTLVGAPTRRTPTVAFTVAGRTPQQLAADLAAQGVCVWAGHYYAIELMRRLGLPDGAVRAGVVCSTTDDEVDRLLEAL